MAKKEKGKKDKPVEKREKGKSAAKPAKLKPAKATSAEPPAPVAKLKVVSPLAPIGGFPALPVIDGVEFAAAAAGVKYINRTDVMLVRLAPGTALAGTFTRSATRSAPVLDCQAKLALPVDPGAGAAIIVNSGNSNAFTGAGGQRAVDGITGAVAAALSLPVSRVFSASTGVIGQPLPHDRIMAAIQGLTATLSPAGIALAAKAIMTTDTFAKGAFAEIDIDGQPIRIAGIAKGSGMIAPDMATMLVYLFTDAKIGAGLLQKMVSRLTETTFNCITVDSDNSTSDSLMIAATGQSKAPEIKDLRGKPAKLFEAALGSVMLDLAHQVVRDGEGATKFVTVAVSGANSDADAKKVGLAIANSPLVKTAIAGEDPNWGRIVMAVGKSGAMADRDKLIIHFGDVLVAENGWVAPGYREEDGAAYMKREDLLIRVGLGLGKGTATIWTCDLTHRYIEINADYRS